MIGLFFQVRVLKNNNNYRSFLPLSCERKITWISEKNGHGPIMKAVLQLNKFNFMFIFSYYQKLVNLWSWAGTGPWTSTWKPSLWMLTCLVKAMISHLNFAGHGKHKVHCGCIYSFGHSKAVRKNLDQGARHTFNQGPTPPLANWVTLGMSLNLSKLPLPHLQKGETAKFTELLRGLSED